MIDKFPVDFVCLSKSLVVEIDGEIHDDPHQQGYDAERTGHLAELGFRVVRFRNEQVLKQLDAVLVELRKHLAE